jgi:hypothetical protein
MIMRWILFILSAIKVEIPLLCLLSASLLHEKISRQNLYCKPCKIVVSQYRKKIYYLGIRQK